MHSFRVLQSTSESRLREYPRCFNLLTEQNELGLNTAAQTEPESTGAPLTDITVVDIESLSIPPAPSLPRVVDSKHDLVDFFRRPRKILSVPTLFLQKVNLWNAWAAIPQVASFLEHWHLFHGTPTVTLTWTGSSSYLGLMRVCFMPVSPIDTSMTYPAHARDLTADAVAINSVVQHVDIDFSEVGTAVVELAYPHPQAYVDWNVNDWEVYFIPINHLKVAQGITAPALEITMWASYELDMIVPQGKGPEEAPPGVVSTALQYAANIAAVVPWQYATMFSSVASAGSALARSMGFTRPPVEPQNAQVMRTNTALSVCSGAPDMAYTLATAPEVSRNMAAKVPLSQEGETTIDFYRDKWCQVITDLALGQLVVAEPNAIFVAGLIYDPSPLNMLSLAFEKWNGAMTYCLDIRSSPLIRWRLGVVIVPPGVLTPAVFPDDGQLQTHIVECVGSTCFEFNVPYMHAEDFQDTTLTPLTVDTLSLHQRVVVFEMIPPTGPSPTPVIPYINLWAKGGEDLSFGIPSLTQANEYTAQGLGVASVATFGETIDDVTALTKRSVRIGTFHPVAPFLRTVLPVYPPIPRVDFDGLFLLTAPGTWDWDYRSFFGLMYHGASGGGVVRLVPNKTVDSGMATITATSLFGGIGLDGILRENTSGRGAMIFATPEATSAEVSLVDRNYQKFYYPTCDLVLQPVEAVEFSSTSGSTSNPFHVWTSARDDFQFGGFIAPRRLQRRV